MFPRVTHPSATDVLLRPFDLHVLGLPPAFVLSQDQTLRLNENLSLTGHSRSALDESQAHLPANQWSADAGELKLRDRQSISHRPRSLRT